MKERESVNDNYLCFDNLIRETNIWGFEVIKIFDAKKNCYFNLQNMSKQSLLGASSYLLVLFWSKLRKKENEFVRIFFATRFLQE